MPKYYYLKRILDTFFAYILLFGSYIPMLIISILILIFDGRPIVFKQTRVGEKGKTFVCYKFRTMRRDAPSNLSTNEFKSLKEYRTKLGGILRRTSLDELPQLFNVLSGEMSLIGPRPLIPEEKEIHRRRAELGVYKIKPGITGLAQICGRDDLSDERKSECDAIYANNMSFRNDFKILTATVTNVVKKSGNADCIR